MNAIVLNAILLAMRSWVVIANGSLTLRCEIACVKNVILLAMRSWVVTAYMIGFWVLHTASAILVTQTHAQKYVLVSELLDFPQ